MNDDHHSLKATHGGKRRGAGAKPTGKKNWVQLGTTISQEAREWLDTQENQCNAVNKAILLLANRDL